ncbi:DUF393 domain-containing protein [Puniceicoccaceae bacterium K14]|nr:DUF393 domain-containing protein [Puniceicoccaceae bacterium K14]
MSLHKSNSANKIVFFDGSCGICSTSIRLLLKIDRKRLLSYTPLQGETAQAFLDPKLADQEDLSTIVYLNVDDDNYTRSDAILAIFKDLGWPYKVLYAFKVLPTPIRDWFYDIIAKNRFSLSKKMQCRLLTPEEGELFLP